MRKGCYDQTERNRNINGTLLPGIALMKKLFSDWMALFVFGATLLFFTDGGVRGGSFLWFVPAFVLMPLFFRVGRYPYYMLILLLVCLCNIVTGIYFPGSVRGTSYRTADMLVPFVLVLLILGVILQLYELHDGCDSDASA